MHRPHTPRLTLALPVLALAACGSPGLEEPVARIDLRTALGVADVSPTGVTVDATSGRRFVFDDQAGLYELASDGSATRVMAMADLPDPGTEVRLPFTDLVALGEDRFALTAIGDGFLLDTSADTLELHFCYEPGGFPGEEQEQRTDAVTYDATRDHIIAQPRTTDLATGEVLASQIGHYDRATGVDVAWHELEVEFAAGGMAVAAETGLLLGAGSSLHRHDAERGLEPVGDLAHFGVDSIEGMAVDAAAGTLLVLDGDDELVEIDLAALELAAP